MSAWVSYPEARAALGAARRSRRISAPRLARARADLDGRWEAVEKIVVDRALAVTAGEAAERFALRALDAVHLAAALTVADDDLVLATWDEDLSRAARDAGLRVAP